MNRETLTPVEGVPTGIGYYLAGLEEVREQLRDAVEDLSNEMAHSRLRPDTHSITQLILHCGEAEWWWIQCVVNGREVDDELKKSIFWDVLEEGKEPPRSLSAKTCVAELDRISALSVELLAGFSDDDLDRMYRKDRGERGVLEVSLRWILHHLIDHEAQHKGQILMLKRLLKSGN